MSNDGTGLRECPFCGMAGKAKVYQKSDVEFYVACIGDFPRSGCGCQVHGTTQEQAIARWNRRALSAVAPPPVLEGSLTYAEQRKVVEYMTTEISAAIGLLQRIQQRAEAIDCQPLSASPAAPAQPEGGEAVDAFRALRQDYAIAIATVESRRTRLAACEAALEERDAAYYSRPAPAQQAWQPIETAPKGGVILLAVRGYEDTSESRTYVAEMSHKEDGPHWIVTTGWTGWTRLHGAWEPVGWQPLPEPPALTSTAAKAAEGAK